MLKTLLILFAIPFLSSSQTLTTVPGEQSVPGLSLFVWLAISIFTIFALVFYWNIRLRREVSRRRQVEAELLDAKQLAEQASLAKSAFLANMSHDLRTPMNAVLGFTTLLQNTDKEESMRQYLQGIETAGKSLLQLIDDILDLSRIEAGRLELHWEDINIYTLFSELERMFGYFAQQKGLMISFDIHPLVPDKIWLDEVRLRQVLVNLVSNAIKFTEQGSIVVFASAVPHNTDSIRLEIEVRDTGIGISTDGQEKIFESFEQQANIDREKCKGTGLGLAISRKLVNMMGGEITLQSREQKGSVFTVVFPLVQTH